MTVTCDHHLQFTQCSTSNVISLLPSKNPLATASTSSRFYKTLGICCCNVKIAMEGVWVWTCWLPRLTLTPPPPPPAGWGWAEEEEEEGAAKAPGEDSGRGRVDAPSLLLLLLLLLLPGVLLCLFSCGGGRFRDVKHVTRHSTQANRHTLRITRYALRVTRHTSHLIRRLGQRL